MWRREQVFFNTQTYFDELLRAIDDAVVSVEMEMYIFERDALGMAVLGALERAAARGLSVRLVIDGLGSPDWSMADLRALAHKGVLVRVYHPAPWPLSRLFRHDRISLSRFFRVLRTLNRRNHKKVAIIDGDSAFTGSMNISIAHSRWRETSVRVCGEEIRSLQDYFSLTWSHSYNPEFPKQRKLRRRVLGRQLSERLVRTNITRRLRRRHNRELVQRVGAAQKQVWLTNAYFIPSTRLVRALMRAALRGTDVRLLLPRHSDVRLVRWVSLLFYRTLMRAGVRIFEYLPSMLHAKTVLLDDRASVGTTNLNSRSLYHDLEVDVVVMQPATLQRLKQQFLDDLEHAEEVGEDWLQRRPLYVRFAGFVGSWLKWYL